MDNNIRKIPFNVNAYTARLIGRENVAKLEGAVLEIVKNAYDADAKVFCFYYCNAENRIYILDNGTGMTEETIRTHWMTIGNSSKKTDYFSENKRIQTGAKGIGRFALDRIADKCEMLTISDAGALEWIVNWGDFDGDKNLSDVTATIAESDKNMISYVECGQWNNTEMSHVISKIGFQGKGTALILDGLHDVWSEKVFSKIRNNLENLLPPDVAQDFRMFYFDDNTKGESAEIISANIESYDYKIEFQVEDHVLNIQIQRNEFDFGSDAETVYREAGFDENEQAYFRGTERVLNLNFQEIGEKTNYIGKYNGILYFNKISSSQKDNTRFYYKDIKGRKNLTKDFGGIKIYRDHFRVRPYGEYGDFDFDWLGLSARNRRSPAGIGNQTQPWRVASEQMLGIINISRINTNLDDAANRNGIQEGIGFSQLKRIILTVITEFERDRQSVGRKLAAYADYKDQLAAELEKIRMLAEEKKKWEAEQKQKQEENTEKKENIDNKSDLAGLSLDPSQVQNVVEALQEKQEEEIQVLQNENKLLQVLATAGIVTNMFMHEIRTLTNNIGQELDAAYEAIKYDQDMESAFENVKRAITFKKNFASWFAITIESIKKDKRQRKKHNIKELISPFLDTWKAILFRSHVDLKYNCDEDIEFRCFAFDIEVIISNLISNSLVSFDREMDTILEKKEIIFDIKKEQEGFVIFYKDTGWGLVPKYQKRPELILEAFESDRGNTDSEDEGTGMGMWIIHKILLEYNGAIDLDENKNAENGFVIRMSFGGRYV